jgi:hypothetical protein
MLLSAKAGKNIHKNQKNSPKNKISLATFRGSALLFMYIFIIRTAQQGRTPDAVRFCESMLSPVIIHRSFVASGMLSVIILA